MDRKTHTTSPYPAEFHERAARMVIDRFDSYATLTAAVRDIAGKPGCSADSLRVWCRQMQRDAGKEAGPASAEKARIKELERENRELRQANEILKKGEPMERQWSERHWRTRILPGRGSTARFASEGLNATGSREGPSAFIDEFRKEFGVEPICRVLPIAPSTCHARKLLPGIHRGHRHARGAMKR